MTKNIATILTLAATVLAFSSVIANAKDDSHASSARHDHLSTSISLAPHNHG